MDGGEGSHELSHVNGEITARNMRGSVVANTTNGEVVIELLEVDPDTPMSFSTFNGDVEVTLPTSAKGNLYMQSGQGDVYTDFDVQLQPTKPKVTRDQEGDSSYRVRMEKAVEGTIDTTGLSNGRHTVFIEGQDTSGAWGPVSAVFLYVIDPAVAPTVQGTVRDADTLAALAGVDVTIGGFEAVTDGSEPTSNLTSC